ncbi:MAG: porin family protein, partial [Bacteroidota bacterium]
FIFGFSYIVCDKSYAQISVGLKSEYHFSQVNFDPDAGLNFALLPGLTMGAVMKISANPNVGLQAEINYVQKGWTEDFSRAGEPEELLNRLQTYRYNYIEVPILTHIYVGGKKINVFFNLGPHLSFLMGTDSTSSNVLPTDTASYVYDNNTAIGFEFGISAGAGLAINIGRSTLQIEGRLTRGLNNIIDRDTDGAPTGSTNQVIGISLSYLYRIRDLSKLKKEVPDE